jgi:hypothetical protein
MFFGLGKDNKLNRDKKIKSEKTLQHKSAGKSWMQLRER